jgi:hypothetical protein
VTLEDRVEPDGAGVAGVELDVEPERLGGLGRLLEPAPRERCREVLQRPSRRGDADPGVGRSGWRSPWPVNSNGSRAPKTACTGNGDVDPGRFGGPDAPQRRGAAVAQHGAVAGSQHRRQVPGVPVEHRVADGVDATVEAVQAPVLHSTSDRVAVKPHLVELGHAHYSVLHGGQLGEPPISPWGC